MSNKARVVLHAIVSIGANLIILGIIPTEYKAISIMVFNIAQVLYAYFDPTYAFVKLGKIQSKVL